MTVRDLIVAIDDHDAMLTLYNNSNDPEITRAIYDVFLQRLLAITPMKGSGDLKVILCYRADEIYIGGEGWDFYDGHTWAWMDCWDVEWRPAAEVLAMEVENRTDLSIEEVTMWLLEELGVYLARPRTA